MGTIGDITATDLGDIYAETLAASAGPLYVLNPTADALDSLARTLAQRDGEDARVVIIAEEDRLRDLGGDFVVRTLLADRLERDSVSLYHATFDDGAKSNLLVSPEAVTSVVPTDRLWGGLRSDDEALTADVFAEAERLADEASEHDLRTPGISRLRTSLKDSLGSECEADFARVFSRVQTVRGSGDRLDEATLLLLVTAKNGALFYDLGRWSEGVSLVSKATLSRKKSLLEERGIVETEDVPVEVGRPRHRLRLADERLREADAAELSSVALTLSAV